MAFAASACLSAGIGITMILFCQIWQGFQLLVSVIQARRAYGAVSCAFIYTIRSATIRVGRGVVVHCACVVDVPRIMRVSLVG